MFDKDFFCLCLLQPKRAYNFCLSRKKRTEKNFNSDSSFDCSFAVFVKHLNWKQFLRKQQSLENRDLFDSMQII